MNCVALLVALSVFQFAKPVRSNDEELEVVLLPIQWSSGNATVPLSFRAFGEQVDLLLEKNENLLTPNFEVWKRGSNDVLERKNHLENRSSCQYVYESSLSSAAVSLCDTGTVHGFVFLENDSLEITPLRSEDEDLFRKHRIQVRSTSYGEPHVIKRRRVSSHDRERVFDPERFRASPRRRKSSEPSSDKRSVSPLTIELAVFFDATAHRLFHPHLSRDDDKLLDMLLAYINNIQALYYHPSLGQRIELALVRLELMERQPKDLAHLDGERGQLLDTFCAYAKKLNPAGDDDPGHWDMALYISGMDFYAMEDGKKNPITMGLAPVGGVCWDEYACVIAEFGVTNRFGKPYPSAGFTSVYIAAHEIAHNLGMHHDSTGNSCPKDGYIMSPSRGVQGETHWSSCSREVANALGSSKRCLLDRPRLDYRLQPNRHLDHSGRFSELPGRHWSAKRQCELLLRDRKAQVDSLKDCCKALRCRTPNREGFYFAGPALDGTSCEKDKECRAGDCLPVEDKWEALPPLTTPSPGASGWSDWREGVCESGCIRGSLGYQERRRICLGESSCPGSNVDVILCKDAHICDRGSRKRLDVLEFAGQRCLEFAEKLDEIDGVAGGLQAGHEELRPWMACAVFCKRSDIASYYTPRLELNDLGMDPYFPDGTWCHKDEEGVDYFCRRHHCLPENFRFGKGLTTDEKEEEDLLGPMNARPKLRPEVVRYLSLDLNGKPLLGSFEPREEDEDAWLDTKDYVELPDEFLARFM
ncbi:hypothetical protein TSAR_006047 [Trichomalopsis sarcophagae]|uniref:Peptidase M12B domain-containing protein n=1 Tax=Trichomalopsis sarcophagae TaxID=543379 RepID=A0A232F4Y4_9HYME|nr:hypothetical protein TSAR_006047 [Trichomalopsis sarcophagae]